MTYVKIEDDIFRHPKVVQVSSSAKLIYIASICYCGHQLTDGLIPRNAAMMLCADAGVRYSPKLVSELVTAGLWHESPGGYLVHDYLTYNESSEKVQAKKEAARKRMERLRSGDVRANTERTSEEVRDTTTTTDTFSNEKDISSDSAPNYSDEFMAFWRQFPTGKGNKKKTYDQWKRLKPSDELQATILDRLEAWKSTQKWRDGFVTHAERWLRDRGWEDDLPNDPRGNLTVVHNPHYAGGYDPMRKLAPDEEATYLKQLEQAKARALADERKRGTA